MTKETAKPIQKATGTAHTEKKVHTVSSEKFINLPFWIPALVFIATTLVFFWDQLAGSSFFWEDIAEYVFPTQTFAAREAANGNIPFWNPFIFSGMPFLADLQVGFFYPLNRILSFFVDSKGDLPIGAIQFIIILHFFISQICFYYLAKYFKISSIGSIIGSIAYSFSMLMVCHVIHPGIIYHLAWLPLIIFFVLKSLNENRILFSVIAGFILGMSLLSGHPQTTLYEGLLIGFFIICFFINRLKDKQAKSNIIKLVLNTLLPFIFAVGIFAVQYLPSQELAGLSQRNEITKEKAAEGSLEFKQVFSSVVPNLFGTITGTKDKNEQTYFMKYKGQFQAHFYWETAFYFSVAALLLGLIGIVAKYKTKEGILLLIISIFGFLYALGDNFFIFNIFTSLPLFGSFRNPGRIMFFTTLGFGIFAGYGFDFIYQQSDRKQFLIKLLLIVALPLSIALLASTGVLGNMYEAPKPSLATIQSFGTTSLVIILIISVLAVLGNRRVLNSTILGAIFAIIVFIDLFSAGAKFNRCPDNPKDVYNATYKENPSLKSLITPKVPDDLFRVKMRIYRPVSFMALQRNSGMVDRVQLLEGYNPLILERVGPPLLDEDMSKRLPKEVIEARQSRINDLLNVRYEVAIKPSGDDWYMKKKDSCLPRAYLVHRAVQLAPQDVSAKMKANMYDFANEVVIEEDPQVKLSGRQADSIQNIKCLDYQNNYFKYQVQSYDAGILCLSEIWYPAWKVYVNGVEKKMLRSNYAFRAVALEAGENTVEMKFESDAYAKGSMISLITLGAGLVLLVVSYFKKF